MQRGNTEPPAAPRRPKVLVVDDEAANLATLARVFRRELDVTLATSAEEALAIAARDAFDVALVDYRMPEMDGCELLRRLTTLQPKCARFLVTAHDQLKIVIDAERHGLAMNIIPKPWQKATLLKLIEKALDLPPISSSVHRRGGPE